MYKSLASLAAATMLAAFATTGPTAAADRGQVAGVDQQQNMTEEFTSQRRRHHRSRVVVRSYAPRYYYPRGYAYYDDYPYAYGYPYAYATPYPYAYYPYYRRPGISVGIGPFGFRAW